MARMIIEGVESFEEAESLEEIGGIGIRETFSTRGVRIDLPGEIRKLDARKDINKPEDFLGFVETILQNNNWYIAEARYWPSYERGFLAKNKIYGRLYTGKRQ